MKSVDINIISTVKNEDGEDRTEFFTTGRYKRTENGYVIGYDENEGIGYASCKVQITAEENKVTMERTGPAAATLIIEKNVKHHCVYGTPYGEFTMGINTFEVNNGLDEKGGSLSFKYCIDINSDFISENRMEITIK